MRIQFTSSKLRWYTVSVVITGSNGAQGSATLSLLVEDTGSRGGGNGGGQNPVNVAMTATQLKRVQAGAKGRARNAKIY